MRSKDIGELAEVEFMRMSMRIGLIVSEPRGDNQKYDFIVDNGANRSRVQVKSTTTYIESKNCYQVSTCYGSQRKSLYTHKDIDFFACYIQPEDVWYIIPVNSVHTTKIRIPTNSDVSKYSPFKEAWHLLH